MKTGSVRRRTVADWFGIDEATMKTLAIQRRQMATPMPARGQILLITGPSGAGKSSCLASLKRRIPRRLRIDLNELALPRRRSVVDCFPKLSVEETLQSLCRVGLGEASTYLFQPRQLSDGQKWRLKLALCLERARVADDDEPPCIVCDEFAALLDRVTARIVARLLRRAVDEANLRAVVATSHDDLHGVLAPDIVVSCDFGMNEVRATERGLGRRGEGDVRRTRGPAGRR